MSNQFSPFPPEQVTAAFKIAVNQETGAAIADCALSLLRLWQDHPKIFEENVLIPVSCLPLEQEECQLYESRFRSIDVKSERRGPLIPAGRMKGLNHIGPTLEQVGKRIDQKG